jgi:hypothetical protein
MLRSIHFYEDFVQAPTTDVFESCAGCAFQAAADECSTAPDCVPGPDNTLTQRVIFVRKVAQ